MTLVDPDRAVEQAERVEAWGAEIRPATERARWALGRAVAASFQIERCEDDFDALAVEQRARAGLSWEGDRRAEAGDLAERLAKHPSRVARRLESTRHGCELLIERWERLGEAAESEAGWGEVEVSAALDLLGVAAELRQGRTPASPTPGSDPVAHRRDLVRRQIDRLSRKKAESLDELDDLARRQAEAGALLPLTGPGQLLQRYQRDAWRRYHASIRAAQAPAPEGDEGGLATIRVAVEPGPEPEAGPTRPPGSTQQRPTTDQIRACVESLRAKAGSEPEWRPSRLDLVAALATLGPEREPERPAPVVESGPPLNRRARRALAARSRRA